MVLDVKALSWAAQNGIDTAKLKAAKVPIYGKWYFPEIPAGVPLVNLDTGERRTFPERMIAGEVMWVAERDLRRASLGLSEEEPVVEEVVEVIEAPPPPEPEPEPEPLLAMARPPEGVAPAQAGEDTHAPLPPPASVLVPLPAEVVVGQGDPASIHLPRASIAPLVLGFGISIALVGLIVHPVLLVVGLLWSLVGAIGWIRIGLLEYRDAGARGVTQH